MKNKIIALFAGLLLVSTSAFAIPAPTYSVYNDKSDRTGNFAPVRELKLVRMGDTAVNGASIASGDAVIYDTLSADGITVRLTTTSADGAFAGIAVTAIQTCDVANATSFLDDRNKRNWGWIIVHGPAVANITAGGSNGVSAKGAFVTSKDSGKITGSEALIASPDGAGASNIATTFSNKGGFFFGAAASGTATTVGVFVENE